MSVFIFLAALIIAYFIVKIGAAAFELTGLNPEQARFQSLSAFSGTGFTTRESELVTIHSQRRKIASTLMILGNAGIVTLMATLANSIRPDTSASIILPVFLKKYVPLFVIPYFNLLVFLIILFLIYRSLRTSTIMSILIRRIQKEMVNKKLIYPVSFEELLLNAKGYGVSKIEITENNPLLGKSLVESNFRKHGILVLSIERDEAQIVNPSPNIEFELKDRLICFGKLENIREFAYEDQEIK